MEGLEPPSAPVEGCELPVAPLPLPAPVVVPVPVAAPLLPPLVAEPLEELVVPLPELGWAPRLASKPTGMVGPLHPRPPDAIAAARTAAQWANRWVVRRILHVPWIVILDSSGALAP